jgi:hypothetical protein
MRATIRARYGLLMWRSPSLSMANVIQQCRIAQEAYHASHDPGALWIAYVAVAFAVYG